MTSNLRLHTDEREFFVRLADLIFANPFATDTSTLGPVIGLRAGTRASREHALTVLQPTLNERLRRLEARGITGLGAVAVEDRQFLEYAYLLQAYNAFGERFEKLIQAQLERGDEPADVPFAGEMLQHLGERGFPDDEALWLLALFYQIFRAYCFIDRALVGDCASMERIRRALWNNVFTSDIRAYREHLWNRMEDFSTLLLGETGTGKGSAASAIGRSGFIPFDRRTGRFACSFTSTFIATNLSQFPESLIESELFGHRKGAFTGAIDDHQGLFQRCSRYGSLFLDEIGDLSVHVQLKLLNVIQDRVFSPVGSRVRIRFEGRVIAATNRSLQAWRREGRFRNDFFYRLSSDVIEVPPLCIRIQENPTELEQLVRLLLARITGRSRDDLAEAVLCHLRADLPENYAWPGNVRELEQAVRRVLLKGSYSGEPQEPESREAWFDALSEGRLTAAEVVRAYCRMPYRRYGTYEAVAGTMALDRRTVKRYVRGGPAERGAA